MNIDVLNGMLLCIGIQLLFLSFFHFKNNNSIEIGLICMVLGLGQFYSIFFEELNMNLWGNLLLGDYKSLIIPSLLYLHLRKRVLATLFNKRLYAEHLIFPITILLIYLFVKFYFTDYYLQNLGLVLYFFWIPCLGVFTYYLFLSVRLLNRNKKVITSKAYERYGLIVTLISFFLIVQIISLLTAIFDLRFEKETLVDFLIDFSAMSSFLALAIFESRELKKFFIRDKVVKKEMPYSKESKIQKLIQKNFIELKAFKLNSFDLRKLLDENKISEKDFNFFIKENYGLSTTAYVNKLRIEEFMSLSFKGLTEKFDIVGLARLCGFKSKTTFYRVFKKEFGVTPSDYFNNL